MRVLLATFALVPAAAGTVEAGTINVNKGAVGITLGMTRAAVIAKLGKPVYQNANGFMQYSNRNLLDVYFNNATKRVRLIGVSGKHFCLAGGGMICMLTNGGIAKLKARYGKTLKLITEEDGSKTYRLRGALGGRQVFTSFTPGRRGQIIQVFIGYY
jgi:hypothetical protein